MNADPCVAMIGQNHGRTAAKLHLAPGIVHTSALSDPTVVCSVVLLQHPRGSQSGRPNRPHSPPRDLAVKPQTVLALRMNLPKGIAVVSAGTKRGEILTF